MRAAIYFTPPAADPLTRVAALWLGRDAFTGEPTREADPAVDPLVAEPARYGFHATMRAPFRLRDGAGTEEVEARLRSFAAERGAFVLPKLVLARLGRFLAMVPAAPSPDLAALEGAVLDAFEPFRAPLNEAEIARRRPDRLTERQRDHLRRWGYPFVREDFRFHMTLTGSLPEDELDTTETRLRHRFADVDGRPLAVDGIALFVEETSGGPFRARTLARFGS